MLRRNISEDLLRSVLAAAKEKMFKELCVTGFLRSRALKCRRDRLISILKRLGTLHFSLELDPFLWWPFEPGRQTTPLEAAMISPHALGTFFGALIEAGINVRLFCLQEKALLKNGWTEVSVEGLTKYAKDTEKLQQARGFRCRCCKCTQKELYFPEYPHWTQDIVRIRLGLDPSGHFTEEEGVEREQWAQQVQQNFDGDTALCRYCWEHIWITLPEKDDELQRYAEGEEAVGNDDEEYKLSDDESRPSPGLLDIEF
jgi:hypothetical protein